MTDGRPRAGAVDLVDDRPRAVDMIDDRGRGAVELFDSRRHSRICGRSAVELFDGRQLPTHFYRCRICAFDAVTPLGGP